MNAETQVLGSAALVFVGIVLGKYIDAGVIVSASEFILPALSTLAAAFLGAWYAFSLQDNKNRREQEDRQIAALNLAIFALARKQSKLQNIIDQVLEPWKTNPVRFLMMPPTHDLEKDDIAIDFSALAYLLETKHSNLLGHLAIAVAKYRSAIDALNLRSALHKNDVQTRLEAASTIGNEPVTLAEIRQALGERLFITLEQATDQAIGAAPRALEHVTDISAQLTNAGRSLFPPGRVIRISPLSNEPQT